jgi:hypothetical protein
MKPRVVVGDHMNEGKVALFYGPLVLAADEALLPASSAGISAVSVANSEVSTLGVTSEPALDPFRSWIGARVFKVNAVVRKPIGTIKAGTPMEIRMVPFADAGTTGSSYKVWLPLWRSLQSGNVLLEGSESRSRPGNQDGSINDENPQAIVVTFDGKPAAEDWYAVSLAEPVAIQRVVFTHGRNFHDGGWFDVSGGKPKVQIRATADGEWQTVGELGDYPSTTATADGGIKAGQKFTLRLATPVKALAARVIGKPASGSNPAQAFSSCGELEAFAN